MSEKTENKLKNRWAVLEEKAVQLTAILDDLEKLENEETNVKTTMAYMLIEKELKLFADQQHFIESLLK